MSIIDVAKLELRTRRRWKRFDVLVLILLSMLALTATAYSLSTGVRIDRGMFTSNVKLGDPLFKVSKDPDVMIVKGGVILKGDERSLAAFDELRIYIKRVYDEWLWKEYGNRAFPVLLRLVRIKTKIVLPSGIRTAPKEVVKAVEKRSKGGGGGLGNGRISLNISKAKGTKVKTEFLTPDELRPPSLLNKIVYAFGFIIPVYFVVQVYSSSAVEDKIRRRFEVLFTSLSPWEVILGKMIPYMILSIALSTIALILLGRNPIYEVYIVPVVIFLLALSTFTAMLSRSYKEMTFLTIILSISVTVYLFMPAIFSEFLFGGISPITRILNGELDPKSYLISTFQFWSMSVVLLYLSLNSLEVMNSQSDILEKLMEISRQTVTGYLKLFLAVFLSIPFIFVIEFFTLSLIFMFENAIYIVLLIIAVIEELFKGTLIYSSIENGCNRYISALIASFGFFLGEKMVLLPYLPIGSLTYFPIPLIAHILASLLFVLSLRFGFRRALAISSAFHAVYDGVIVWSLLR